MNVRTFLEKTTSDLRNRTNSFKFYVPTVLGSPQQLALEENGYYSVPQPDLLSGEIVIKDAHQVILFPNPLDRKRKIVGNLFVTNYRIFLVPTSLSETKLHRQINLLIGMYGTCLANIESIYQISGNKSRKLFAHSNLTSRIKCLRIVCKNMRVMTFSFEQSPYDHGKHITKTVLHHAFPGRIHLLFAFEYSAMLTGDDTEHGVLLYTSQRDWAAEIKRTCRNNEEMWRVSSVNVEWAVSLYLPQWLVVPKSLLDIDVMEMGRSFSTGRPPTWSWSQSNGAALVRMADCLPAIIVRTQENRFMENLRALHPNKKAPIMMELDKLLPSIRDIQSSYVKLRELCIPDSKRQFETQENKYHALLDSSKWLSYVSMCLQVSSNAAQHITSGLSVVLQEGDGRDSSALVSSLVQMMLDPRCRTILGFQSLIQKEWVALGHPFCSRLGHVRESAQEQSAVFPLFLDCVWQLQRQCIASFEFSETYLTTLFDSIHNSIFDTFLFDCERHRQNAKLEENFKLRSVWNWGKQFHSSDIVLFSNPLYQVDDLIVPQSPKKSHMILEAEYEVYHLEVWAQCYMRWLPALAIHRGGCAPLTLLHTQLRTSIEGLLAELADVSKKTPTELALERAKESLCSHSPIIVESLEDLEVDNFFPFSNFDDDNSTSLADCSMYSDFDTQSVLNLTE